MADAAAALPAETEPKAPRNPKADALTAALEGMRQRLATLDLSINDYGNAIVRQPGMPPYEILQTKAQIVAKNLAAVAEHQAACHGIFTEAVVFPLPEFPDLGDQGHLLSELLRKRLDPGLEDWLEDAELWADKWVGMSAADQEEGEDSGTDSKLISGKGWQELWLDAPGRVVNEASGNSRELGTVDYTKAEREMGVENVRTGLKRELRQEPEIDDSDSEDEDMEVDDQEGEDLEDRKRRALRKRQEKEKVLEEARTKREPKALPMVDVLKFMSAGPPPPKSASKIVQAGPTVSNGIAT